MRVQVATRLRRRKFFSYKSLNARKRRVFLSTSYIQGQVRESQGSRRVRQGWSIATRRGHEKVKKRKRPRKARRWLQRRQRSVCPKPRIHFFGSRVLGRDPSRLKYRLLRYFFMRKPCAKEVPETDYLTQWKQYLKRTTLRRLKILLQSICIEEGPHYRLSEAWARKLSSDKQQLTFIHELGILLVIPYLGYTA